MSRTPSRSATTTAETTSTKRNAPEDQGWQFNGENVSALGSRVDRGMGCWKEAAGQYGDRQATEIAVR